jgi:hypothetical protein
MMLSQPIFAGMVRDGLRRAYRAAAIVESRHPGCTVRIDLAIPVGRAWLYYDRADPAGIIDIVVSFYDIPAASDPHHFGRNLRLQIAATTRAMVRRLDATAQAADEAATSAAVAATQAASRQ